MKGCRLGFNKILEGKKYKMAMDSLKKRGLKRGSTTEYEKKFTLDYITMCVMLLSIAEKTRPVTIVDILRRQKVLTSHCTNVHIHKARASIMHTYSACDFGNAFALPVFRAHCRDDVQQAEAMLKEQASRKAPRKPKEKGAKQHASQNLAPENLRDKKLDALTEKDICYSYNLYVILDQLARIAPDAKYGETNVRLTPEELKGLKELVDENDEDLLIYFEEYVEKSGPVYEGDPRWKGAGCAKKSSVSLYELVLGFCSSDSIVGRIHADGMRERGFDMKELCAAFCRFGAKAKEIFARSKKAKKGGGKGGDKDEAGKEDEDGEEDEDAEEEDDQDEEGEGTC